MAEEAIRPSMTHIHALGEKHVYSFSGARYEFIKRVPRGEVVEKEIPALVLTVTSIDGVAVERELSILSKNTAAALAPLISSGELFKGTWEFERTEFARGEFRGTQYSFRQVTQSAT